MKYRCKICLAEFDDPIKNKQISSLLIRYLTYISCPCCKSIDVELTEKFKLQLERKTKIIKIENDNTEGIS